MAGIVGKIFGLKITDVGTGRLFPGIVLTTDDVVDIVRVIEEARPAVKVFREYERRTQRAGDPPDEHIDTPTTVVVQPIQFPSQARVIKLEDLAGLGAKDRELLRINGVANVELRANALVHVSGAYPEINAAVEEHILRVAYRKLPVRGLIKYLPYLPFLVLLASWLWFVLAYSSPLPLVIAGSLFVFFALVGTVFWSRAIRKRNYATVGVRYREHSRAELRHQALQSRGALITFFLTSIVIGPLAAWLGSLFWSR